MQKWQVFTLSTQGNPVHLMHVYTPFDTAEEDAADVARYQLDRPGRRQILRKWEETGCLMRPVD